MTDVSFTPSGPPETYLPHPPDSLVAGIDAARDDDQLALVVAAHPAQPLGWAELADRARQSGERAITVYALYRVGYHRGLDLLRANGWKGSGYVRSSHEPNQGFLRCLNGLGEMAEIIGETGEAERCRQFMDQLDP